jgi:hypothetical protein
MDNPNSHRKIRAAVAGPLQRSSRLAKFLTYYRLSGPGPRHTNAPIIGA